MQLNDMAIQQNYSVNVWRLQALENIEMILSQAENSNQINNVVRPSLKRKKTTRNRTIYKFLGHHYIQRRSVVFIVDNEYSGVYYHEKTNKFVNKVFSRLDEEDHFGYISLSKQ